MPRFKKKITIRAISTLTPDPKEETWIWDDELARFAFRLKPSGSGSFLIVYRNRQRRQRQLLVGRMGVVTPEQARALAKAMLADVDAGKDPAEAKAESRDGLTLSELCDQYLVAARAGLVKTRFGQSKRSTTIAIDEGRISRHIVPLIGRKLVKNLRRSDIQCMADDIAQGKTATTVKTKARGVARVTGGHGTAARVVELLGGIWSWAEKRDIVSGASPVIGVDKTKGEAKDRVLNAQELSRLGAAMRAHTNDKPLAVAALRLISLSGLRREEACRLRIDEIDRNNNCLRLRQTKTGKSTRPISDLALAAIEKLPRVGDFVFPGRSGDKPADLKKQIASIFNEAGLNDARSHDLRRTFASAAGALNYSDATIGELLGHAKRGVTEIHYVHRPDAALVAAANSTAARVAAALDCEKTAEIIPLPNQARRNGKN
jgi:integrase